MGIARRTVVGVFYDSKMADRTIEVLQHAGFSLQQISISSHYSETEAEEAREAKAAKEHKHGRERLEGVVERLKRLFTGEGTETDNEPSDVKDDLEGMGLSPKEAQYYEDQYKSGRSVIGVRAEDRVEDAENILRSHGGQVGMSPEARQPGPAQRPAPEQPGRAPGRTDADTARTGAPMNPPETEREQPGRFGRTPDYDQTSEQPRQTEGSAPIEEPHKLNPVDKERARRQREQR